MDNNIEKKTRIINSIKRAADILDIFQYVNQAGISDMAKKLDLPKTTIQGIVKTLLELQYLDQDSDTQKYRLGAKLFTLGMRYVTDHDTMSAATLWGERLSFKLGLPVYGGILVGKSIMLILKIEPEQGSAFFPQAGITIKLHTTTIGKTIMAFLKDDTRNKLLEDYNFEALTPNSITDRETYLKELEEIKKTGISFEREENLVGTSSIGAPILNYRGNLIAAFAVTGSTMDINRKSDEIIEEVRYSSKGLSNQLGYLPELKII